MAHEAGILVSYMQGRQYSIITLVPTTHTPNHKWIHLYRPAALEQGLTKRFIFVQLGLGSVLEGRWGTLKWARDINKVSRSVIVRYNCKVGPIVTRGARRGLHTEDFAKVGRDRSDNAFNDGVVTGTISIVQIFIACLYIYTYIQIKCTHTFTYNDVGPSAGMTYCHLAVGPLN